MKPASEPDFKQHYETHLKHLQLQGLRPKTIAAYARAIRHVGAYFDERIDDLTEAQLTDYFSAQLASHSWSTLKHRLYGLRFYYSHVLHKPCPAPTSCGWCCATYCLGTCGGYATLASRTPTPSV